MAAALAVAGGEARRGWAASPRSRACSVDSSAVSYRVHFCRAALRDAARPHPWVGGGWENFGLLYPGYRSAPTPSIVSDLVPTMVHAGRCRPPCRAGSRRLALQILVFAAVGAVVIRRRRRESNGRQRLLGAAFIASAVAYLVQDLSGWPHVALGALAFVIWGLGVSWSLSLSQPRAIFGPPKAARLLASAFDQRRVDVARHTGKRIRAERLMMFEA